MKYLEKLEELEKRFEELNEQLATAEVLSDPNTYRKVAKARTELEPIVTKFREWKSVMRQIEQARQLLKDGDPDVRELAEEDLKTLEPKREQLEHQLRVLLLPKDPNDERNVLLEIRAGTGGDEATLFAAEIFRMYSRYADSKGWKVEVTSVSESDIGGYKEVIALISGDRVYSRLKYESGVHRVQRVPVTESQGRIHTSTVTVAVLPEPDEVEVKIDPKDLQIDTFCASGPGGQHVNRTHSAVRITHLPTGIVVTCQDERSQIKNRAKAERVLRSRLYELERSKQQEALDAQRRDMIKSGERSEKIRTYNFPQNRVTDHRIGLTLHQLSEILDGNLDPLIDALTTYYEAERLKQQDAAA